MGKPKKCSPWSSSYHYHNNFNNNQSDNNFKTSGLYQYFLDPFWNAQVCGEGG